MQLNRDQLREAFRVMTLIREFEERVGVEFATGDMAGFVHLYAGEEAIAAGVCAHLNEADFIISTHRGHGHCIAKGCDVEGMMMELFGRKDGICSGKGGSMHIADLDRGMLGANGIVGAGGPLGLGPGLTAKTLGTDRVSVIFLGDGASNQGTVFEAMNMAVVLKLPVVFVIENNRLGEATSVDYSVGSGDIAGRASAFGMPFEKVDGTSYYDVWEAMGRCAEHARSGEGPCGFEATAHRYYGHFEGDPQTYRPAGEIEKLRAEADCITLFREKVVSVGLLDSGELDAIQEKNTKIVDASVVKARAAQPPGPEDLETDVYVSY